MMLISHKDRKCKKIHYYTQKTTAVFAFHTDLRTVSEILVFVEAMKLRCLC